MDTSNSPNNKEVAVHWFRHGLRLHDNPALFEASLNSVLYPVFIFDGETAGTMHIGYNRFRFLLECLADLDRQLKSHGGQLFIVQGSPISIFQKLKRELNFTKLCFEQDCEALWHKRDKKVKKWCAENNITVKEFVSHTLWDPEVVIQTNGNVPPLTYKMYLHTVSCIGLPPRPKEDIDFRHVTFGTMSESLQREKEEEEKKEKKKEKKKKEKKKKEKKKEEKKKEEKKKKEKKRKKKRRKRRRKSRRRRRTEGERLGGRRRQRSTHV
ncbi:hypothetical protein M8J76_010944 [Diaphorina citri]|nr:hypothetical protein M8J76_010944 [Diaphorina citri]